MDLFDNCDDQPQDPGAAGRDEGIARVTGNAPDWFAAACSVVARLKDWEGTGEDLRMRLIPVVGVPHTPHAWGALVMAAVRSGWLTRTGERRRMQAAKSHARSTDVYRSC